MTMTARQNERDIALAIDDVSISFGGIQALSNVSFAVPRGASIGLIGPNGAGKTTLLSAIAGQVRPESGRMIFRGRDIGGLTASKRSHAGIARTFQITQPFSRITVAENVMLPLELRGASSREARKKADGILEFVGLEAKRENLAKTLSTGQRKRLELARTLATDPKLLLLDEVTGGVDQPSIPGLVSLIKSLRAERDLTLIVVEHNMSVLSDIADDAVFLNLGQLVSTGPFAEVAASPDLRRIYLGEADAEG